MICGAWACKCKRDMGCKSVVCDGVFEGVSDRTVEFGYLMGRDVEVHHVIFFAKNANLFEGNGIILLLSKVRYNGL